MVAWLAGVGRRAQLHSALAVLGAFLRRRRRRPSLQLRIVRTPSPSEQLDQSGTVSGAVAQVHVQAVAVRAVCLRVDEGRLRRGWVLPRGRRLAAGALRAARLLLY